MLYLTRKIGESIIISDDVCLTVVDVKGKTAKLGFVFPPHVSVLRQELYDRIGQQNKEALARNIFNDSMEKPATVLRGSSLDILKKSLKNEKK